MARESVLSAQGKRLVRLLMDNAKKDFTGVETTIGVIEICNDKKPKEFKIQLVVSEVTNSEQTSSDYVRYFRGTPESLEKIIDEHNSKDDCGCPACRIMRMLEEDASE